MQNPNKNINPKKIIKNKKLNFYFFLKIYIKTWKIFILYLQPLKKNLKKNLMKNLKNRKKTL